jgi:hypothetical protein
MDDRLEMHLLRRDERKAGAKIEAHLMAKDRERTRAGAVFLAVPVLKHVVDEIEIGLHVIGCKVTLRADKW